MEENWTRKESCRAQAHPHHAGSKTRYQRSPIIRVVSTVWVKAEASYNWVCKSRFVFKTQDQYLYVHEVYNNLSSGQNKGNASMLVLGMFWEMMERAVLFGGTNPITQTNGRSPALTWDFYGQSRVWHVIGVLLWNTTVLLLWWIIRWYG